MLKSRLVNQDLAASRCAPVPEQDFPSITGRLSFIFKGVCCAVCQILGFDILLMKNLKPVLLEVNSNPSMRIEHEQEVRRGVPASLARYCQRFPDERLCF